MASHLSLLTQSDKYNTINNFDVLTGDTMTHIDSLYWLCNFSGEW